MIVVDQTTARAESGPNGLAALLREFERSLTTDPPDLVVLGDDSDAALVAALVATKLLIAVEAEPAARRAASANGRLIAQLAGTYTPAA